MWLLSIIPTWVYHLFLVVGIAGLLASLFLSFIPFVTKYSIPLKLISVGIIVMGVWFEGLNYANDYWKLKSAELEIQLATAQAKAAEVNTQIVEKIVVKHKIIKEKSDVIAQKIESRRDAINAECKLSDDAWVLYNAATQNEVSGSTADVDGSSFKTETPVGR